MEVTTDLAAGSSLPLSSGLFDLLIIDEAAQSDLPPAIPLLFCAKRAAIVGDPHQLDHISTLSESADRHLADRHALTDQQRINFGYSGTSLYALAARRINGEPILLNRHFRTHEDIISFSNQTFYSGQLVEEQAPSDQQGLLKRRLPSHERLVASMRCSDQAVTAVAISGCAEARPQFGPAGVEMFTVAACGSEDNVAHRHRVGSPPDDLPGERHELDPVQRQHVCGDHDSR